MAAAIKNWEAQARTNSILAGSLKSLEERVDDISGLLDWYELRFALPTRLSKYIDIDTTNQ